MHCVAKRFLDLISSLLANIGAPIVSRTGANGHAADFFEAHNHDHGRTIFTYERPIATPAGGPGDPASGGHRCSHKGDDADDGGGWLPGFFILLCSNSPIEITKSSQSICLILSHIGHPGEEVILNDDGNERSKVLP